MADRETKKPEMTDTTTTGSEEQISLPEEVQSRLGKELRNVYGKLLAEPLPDRFSELLKKLATDESK